MDFVSDVPHRRQLPNVVGAAMETGLAGKIPRPAIAVIRKVILPSLGPRSVQAGAKRLVISGRRRRTESARHSAALHATRSRHHWGWHRLNGRSHHRHDHHGHRNDDVIVAARHCGRRRAIRVVRRCHRLDRGLLKDTFIGDVDIRRNRNRVDGVVRIILSLSDTSIAGDGRLELCRLAAHSRESSGCRHRHQGQTQSGSEREFSHEGTFGVGCRRPTARECRERRTSDLAQLPRPFKDKSGRSRINSQTAGQRGGAFGGRRDAR